MKMTNDIIDSVLRAESKALATVFKGNINVVPVSTIKIIDNQIILVDYFLGKTRKNIENNPEVALACWTGLEGCQIKAHVEYKDNGEIFNLMKNWVAEILPDRIVKGILILSPYEIYDVSASENHIQYMK